MSDPVSVIPAKILVPIAFNSASHRALDAAAELGGRFGSELYLLHVIFDSTVSPAQGASENAIINKASEVASRHFQVSQARLQIQGIEDNRQHRVRERCSRNHSRRHRARTGRPRCAHDGRIRIP